MIVYDKYSFNTSREIDPNGFLRVEMSNITKSQIRPYLGREIPDHEKFNLDPNKIYNVLCPKDELEKAAKTFNNLPLTREHIEVDVDDVPKEKIVGSLGDHATVDGKYLKNNLIIYDKKDIDLVLSGKKKELSCGYRYTPVRESGEYEGQHYDFKMTDIIGNHVALVKQGRAGRDVMVADSSKGLLETIKEKIMAVFDSDIVGDAEEKKEDEVEWITVKGNHIPVGKGQSKESAIGSFFEKVSKETKREKESDKRIVGQENKEKSDREQREKAKENNEKAEHGFKKDSMSGQYSKEFSNGNVVSIEKGDKEDGETVFIAHYWDEEKQKGGEEKYKGAYMDEAFEIAEAQFGMNDKEFLDEFYDRNKDIERNAEKDKYILENKALMARSIAEGRRFEKYDKERKAKESSEKETSNTDDLYDEAYEFHGGHFERYEDFASELKEAGFEDVTKYGDEDEIIIEKDGKKFRLSFEADFDRENNKNRYNAKSINITDVEEVKESKEEVKYSEPKGWKNKNGSYAEEFSDGTIVMFNKEGSKIGETKKHDGYEKYMNAMGYTADSDISKEDKVGVVMKEFKEGELKSGSGKKVTDPKQAIAIALSEADKVAEDEIPDKQDEPKKAGEESALQQGEKKMAEEVKEEVKTEEKVETPAKDKPVEDACSKDAEIKKEESKKEEEVVEDEKEKDLKGKEKKAFAEGVDYGEKKEKEEPKKLDSEHESEGAKKADKEEKEKKEEMAKDSALVMDADALRAEGREQAIADFKCREKARKSVRSIVGDVDIFAFDSAEDIYKFACKEAGMNCEEIANFKDAFAGLQAGKAKLAMDASPVSGSNDKECFKDIRLA